MTVTRRKPNFLLFITDQQRADHLGCYGNPVLRTPNIDSIARDGTRFENFYVANPVCMPNRASLLTGRMPSLHGVRQNGIPLSLDSVTFVELLAGAGYRTGLIGKAHHQVYGMDRPGRRGWENTNGGAEPAAALQDARRTDLRASAYRNERFDSFRDSAFRAQTPYYGFQHVELCLNHADRVEGDYTRWLEARLPDHRNYRGKDNAIPDARYTAPQTWRTRIPEELYPTAYVAERSSAWLEQRAAAKDEAPFFLQCSFPDPHHPWTPPGRYWDLYGAGDVRLPASFTTNSADLPALAAAIHTRPKTEEARSGQPPFAVSERECREILALNYGMIACIDDAVGRVLDTLRRTGMDRDTVILFTSDHGDYMGDHGLMLKGPAHYRGLVRVPFIWRDPAREASRASCGAASGTIDISATVLDRAGIAPYNGMQGESLLGALEGRASGRPGMVIEQDANIPLGANPRLRLRTLAGDRHRLTLAADPAMCELYDLARDPDEQRNLWDDPAALATRSELLITLASEMARLADNSPMQVSAA